MDGTPQPTAADPSEPICTTCGQCRIRWLVRGRQGL